MCRNYEQIQLPELNTIHEVSNASGYLDCDAQAALKSFLYFACDLPPFSEPNGWQWDLLVTGKGVYVGSLAKRIAKYYYREHSISIPSDMLSKIGSFIADRAGGRRSHYIDITAGPFNWNKNEHDNQFGDGGSCMIHPGGMHRLGGIALENDKRCYAIRFWHNKDGSPKDGVLGKARCWMQYNGRYLLLWNAYGHSLAMIARIISSWLGLSYRTCNIGNDDTDPEGHVYINGGPHYILASAEFLAQWGEDDVPYIDLRVECESDRPRCVCCGNFVDSDNYYMDDWSSTYCADCYYERFSYCEACGSEWCDADTMVEIIGHPHVKWVCEDCASNHCIRCEDCDTYVWIGARSTVATYYIEDERKEVCENCFHGNYSLCDGCLGFFANVTSTDAGEFCESCLPEEEEDSESESDENDSESNESTITDNTSI